MSMSYVIDGRFDGAQNVSGSTLLVRFGKLLAICAPSVSDPGELGVRTTEGYGSFDLAKVRRLKRSFHAC
jgi:hypothetical protein